MSVITNRVAISSVVARVLASSFTTSGTSLAAGFGNPVRIYVNCSSNGRCWLGGTSAVTTANGMILTTGASTSFVVTNDAELWAVSSAASATTLSFMFTNQPV